MGDEIEEAMPRLSGQRFVRPCDYPGLEDVCLYQVLFLARLNVHQGSKVLSD